MKKTLMSVLLILAVGLAAGGCRTQEAEPVETVSEKVAVKLEQVAGGTLRETVSFSGEVTADGEVQVVPKTTGRISSVFVSVGQWVSEGSLLLELDAQETDVAVRQAEAAVAMARANLEAAIAQRENTYAQLSAAVRQAQIGLESAEKNLERMESLYREGAAALQQLEGAKTQYEMAKSQYDAAREQLSLFESNQTQLDVLRAQVEQAEAGLEMALLNQANTKIYAPVDGLVTAVQAVPGNMASPGMPVVTLMTQGGHTVTARLTENNVAQVRRGMKVTVEIPALETATSGEIIEIPPTATAGTRFYPVKIRVNPVQGLKAGMLARVELTVSEKKNVLLVPKGAVLERDGRQCVFVVEGDIAYLREVTTGAESDGQVEIKDGLTEGEQVVVAGQHFLSDGQEVLVEEGEAR